MAGWNVLLKDYIPFMAPTLLICVIAMIFSLGKMQSHPKVAMLALLGFGIVALVRMLPIASFFIRKELAQTNPNLLPSLLLIDKIATTLGGSIGLALIGLAVFTDRNEPDNFDQMPDMR